MSAASTVFDLGAVTRVVTAVAALMALQVRRGWRQGGAKHEHNSPGKLRAHGVQRHA